MEAIPLCNTCKHRHYEGVKCHICGHIGKCKSHRRYESQCIAKHVQDSTISLRVFHFHPKACAGEGSLSLSFKYSFCSSTDNVPREAVGDWQLAKLLRQSIFSNSPNYIPPVHKETRHCLLFVGDIPVAYSSWSLETVIPFDTHFANQSGISLSVEPKQFFVTVDLVGTLSMYRCQGFATKMIGCMLKVGIARSFPPSAKIIGCKILCPPQLKKLCQKFGFRWATSEEAGPKLVQVCFIVI